MNRESLAEFWRYRELFYFLIWRDVKVRYKQTFLGAAWAVLQPFFTMIVFTLFFGKLAQMPSDGIPYPLFSFSALVPWAYFSGAITFSGNSLVTHARLLTKVYFPRITIVVAATLTGLIDFAVASLLLLLLMAYYQIAPGWEILLWPLFAVPLVFLALGIGLILSSLNVRYRDFKYTIPFGIQLWLFLTPIIYPASIIPEKFRLLISLNPLTGIIEAFRTAIFPARALDWRLIAVSLAMTTAIFIIGIFYFQKAERDFADII